MRALADRFEAHNEILSIIRPFFNYDWTASTILEKEKWGLSIASIAAVALRRTGAFSEAFSVSQSTISSCLETRRFKSLPSHLISLSSTAGELNLLALEDRLLRLGMEGSALYPNKGFELRVLIARFRQLSKLGMFQEANSSWVEIDSRCGPAEGREVADHHFVLSLYFQGRLTNEQLSAAEASNRHSALGLRNLAALRGSWLLDQEKYEEAKQSLLRAVELAHKAGKIDRRSEIRLAIAKHQLGEVLESRNYAELYSQNAQGAWRYDLAELWLAIGDLHEAAKEADAAYKWAWSDGEPFVNKFQLNKARNLLDQLAAPIPSLTPYEPASGITLDLERQVKQAIAEQKSALNLRKSID